MSVGSNGTGLAGRPASEEEAADELVRGIREGRLDAGRLGLGPRRRCVDYLTGEGFTAVEVARELGVTERTVRRDLAAVRRRHAVKPRERLGDELLGEFQRVTMDSV